MAKAHKKVMTSKISQTTTAEIKVGAKNECGSHYSG